MPTNVVVFTENRKLQFPQDGDARYDVTKRGRRRCKSLRFASSLFYPGDHDWTHECTFHGTLFFGPSNWQEFFISVVL